MIIFTVPLVPWNLKPILIPKGHVEKLTDLRGVTGNADPSNALIFEQNAPRHNV